MRNWFSAFFILMVTALFSATPTLAAEFDLDTSGKIPDIEIFGTIEPGDFAKFQRITANQARLIVHLNSDGGALDDALKIGALIHDKKWITSAINGYPCNSACALIWLAGDKRFLTTSARVGFHAAYRLNGGKAEESGQANAMVGRYLTLLGLNTDTVVFATTAPPDRLAYITLRNAKSLGIDAIEISDAKEPSAVASNQKADDPTSQWSAVRSGEAKIYGRTGSWIVAIDTTIGNGCYLISEFNNGIVFRIGIDRRPDVNKFYFIVANDSWSSLVEGKKYDLTFTFDDNEPWNVPMTGVRLGSTVMLRGFFKDTSIWTEFTKSYRLSFARNGTYVGAISLSGTNEASDMLLACMKEQRSAPVKTTDPFAE